MLAELLDAARRAGETAAKRDSEFARVDFTELWTTICDSDHVDLRAATFAGDRHCVPLPELDSPLSVIGIDGSQIYPQRSGPIQFAATREIAYQIGPGVVCENTHDLTCELEESPNEEILHALVDAARSRFEIELGASLLGFKGHEFSTILFDGPLLPWKFGAQSLLVPAINHHLTAHLEALSRCHGHNLAGVISSPGSRSVIDLLRVTASKNHSEVARVQHQLSDRHLFSALLSDGERSPVFMAGSRINLKLQPGHRVCFFYVRVNSEILRIDIPEWVAKQADQIKIVHASIVRDSTTLNYPYSLAQAHHHVSITHNVAETIIGEALRSYLRSGGIPFRDSPKTQAKQN